MASRSVDVDANDCLGDETIAAVLEGALLEDAADRARAHLGSCDACRRLVSAAVDAGVADSRIADVVANRASHDGMSAGEIAPGSLVSGKYRIESLLGEGGMGRVFSARQLDLNRLVALKVLRPELAEDPIALKRFQREALLLASLMSEHVVRVYELGQLTTGEPYIALELLQGEDLGEILRRGVCPIDLVSSWAIGACEALAEAHALGIVHRDVKPENLFLARARTADGSGQRLKVLDFGLAKLAASRAGFTAMTADGLILGSPRYMAPEQILGARDVDARADVWSLGATVYHLLAGTPPFANRALDKLLASILEGPVAPLHTQRPDAGAELAAIVHRCLAKDPAARFSSAIELKAALERARDPSAHVQGKGMVVDGRYDLVELVGEGGQGAVYRATQRPLGREVAIKLLRGDARTAPALRDRFVREAAIVQRLEHPNTVRMFDFGVTDSGAPFMVFELVRGRTLEAEIHRGPLTTARVARIAAQVLKALMEAHAHGIVHRDVKPANVVLADHAGEPDFVKLLDFGVARSNDDRGGPALTREGQLVGTPRYMAPEQVAGMASDARSDLYALGLVMAEALTGAPVYQGDSFMAVCAQQASAAPVPLSPEVLGGVLGRVIARATQKAPSARFGSARDMLEMLESAMAGVAMTVSTAPFAPGPHRRSAPPSAAPWPPPLAGATTAPSAITTATAHIRPTEPPARSGGVVLAVLGIALALLAAMGAAALIVVWKLSATPMAATPAGSASSGGRLAMLDEERLKDRLQQQGWAVSTVTRQDFGTCKFVDFVVRDPTGIAGNVSFFFDCTTDATAKSEAARVRKVWPRSWTIAEGDRVLCVAVNEEHKLGPDEDESRDLFEGLVTGRAPSRDPADASP